MIFLPSGHVTTMDNVGETALIPSEVMQYSIASGASVPASLAVLAAPASMPEQIPDADQADPLVRWGFTVGA